ncbi:MAG TPA: IS5/IS1182 family transposase, partial [Clostridium sp.]|nr:IS5/IS1182 family transposase [Clostridium sp.]
HMRNAQLNPEYNAQIAVNSEYIVGVGIFSDRNDLGTLKPMLENMKYDNLNDQYTCHNDKVLKNIGTTTKTSKTDYESIVTNYEYEDCSDCIHKTKCTKAKGNRRM